MLASPQVSPRRPSESPRPRATFPHRRHLHTREDRIRHAIQMAVDYSRFHTPEYFAKVMGVSYWIYRLSDTKPDCFEILRQLKNAFTLDYLANSVRVPGTVHTVGLCIHIDESDDYVIPLSNQPIPTNKPLFLFVPQIQDWTTVSLKQPTPRLVSERVKMWKLSIEKEYLAQEEEIQAEVDCIICSGSVQPNAFIRLGCDHEYCIDCLTTFVQANKDKTSILCCPLCRSPIECVSTKNPETYTTLMVFITNL